MNSVWRRTTIAIFRNSLVKLDIRAKPLHSALYNLNIQNAKKPMALCPVNISYITFRNKSKKQKDLDSDDEQDVYEDDASLSRDSKVLKFNTTSLRTDVILKSALGVSRNKIEQVFYESKIRVNGKKIMKKSSPIKLGSEIDVIKSISPHNPDHLYVSRVEVLNIVAKEENIAITVRRFKNLLIENYEVDPYKASSNEDSNE
ncbi:unnamed protein product [Parnassius mnemosyne]|uniref:Mitochondrial transcription rescue factor 1 C-terminal domain-containing protein n=1 Tax=Parnassius mnemosyne TaxID=213953 RepID=A0AAV1K8L8_9NEOP